MSVKEGGEVRPINEEAMSRRQPSMRVLLLPFFVKSVSDKLNTYKPRKARRKQITKCETRICLVPQTDAVPQECVGKHRNGQR